MTQPFAFTSTYRFQPGGAEKFASAADRITRYYEENEPGLLFFGVYIDPDVGRGVTVMIHPDVASMERHLGLIDDEIVAIARETIDPAGYEVLMLGETTESILEHTRRIAGSGAKVSVLPLTASFGRLLQG